MKNMKLQDIQSALPFRHVWISDTEHYAFVKSRFKSVFLCTLLEL